jgi:hypothetical protein
MFHNCALTAAGTAQCWGDDGYGQLGNNATATVGVQTPVAVLNSAGTGPLSLGTEPRNDFNGDGTSDLLWRNANGAASMWLMEGTAPQAAVAFGPYPGWTITSMRISANVTGRFGPT